MNTIFYITVAFLVLLTSILLFFIVKLALNTIKKSFIFNHVVVIGLSRTANQVALNLAKAGRKVVLVSKEPVGIDTLTIRENGGVVLSETSYNLSLFKKARLNKAKIVFIATSEDDTNIILAQMISRIKKRNYGGGILKLMVKINDADLKNLVSDYQESSNKNLVETSPFNINNITAQYIYDKFPPHNYIDGETIRDKEKIICIVGNNDIATSFLLENSILSQYGDENNLKVFVICENAEVYLKSVFKKFPNISNFLNIVPIELENDNFSTKHKWNSLFINSIDSIDIAYFFGNKDAKLFSSALHFRQFLYEKTQNIRKVPIVVCLPEETEVLSLLDGDNLERQSLSEKYKNEIVIHLVRKYTDVCSVNRLIDASNETEILAKAINYYYSIKFEFNELLNKHFKKSNNQEFLERIQKEVLEFKVKHGEPLQQIEQLVINFTKEYTKNSAEKITSIFGINAQWNNLTDRKKESNRYVARHLDVKIYILRKLGLKSFTNGEIKSHFNYLAPIEHNRWSAEKFAFDFTYGNLPSTDKNLKKILKDTLKIHDQLIPFEKLDSSNKDKDLDMFYLLPLLQKIKENNKD